MQTVSQRVNLRLECVTFLVFIVLTVLPFIPFCQEEDDRVDFAFVFGEDYLYAVNLIRQEPWMADTLLVHGLDPDFALAIVFPELIRYSSIMDYAQIKGLEVLYVQYGKGYADFSVGWFQMKPSFAEKIEADILSEGLDKAYPVLSAICADTVSAAGARKSRLDRLKDPCFQVLYLAAFLRFMEMKFPSGLFLTMADKLAFFATAYNAGYFKGERMIREQMGKAGFYTGLDGSGRKYKYRDVAVYFYEDAARK